MFNLLKNLSERMGIVKDRAPFDPASFNDLVALQTGWHPLERGGASFRTRRLVQKDSNRVELKPTLGAMVFGMVFGGFGLMGLAMFVGFLKADGTPWFAGLIPLLLGSIFLAASVWMIRKFSAPIVFDARKGWFWKGRENPESALNRNDLKCFAELEEVHALQLISEFCRGKDNSYHSYELNLILKSAKRINVFDHGSLKHARADGEKLADFLGVPFWDAVERVR